MSRTKLPRHLQLRERLLRRWKRAGLAAGDRIESQNEILAGCEFSLATVLKTLRDLEADRIITRKAGTGSYLASAPWDTGRWKIGLFYDRTVIDRGLLSREFYAPLLRHLEASVVSGGHTFRYGDFTREDIPYDTWDALDAVLITGLAEDFPMDRIVTSAVVGFLDAEGEPRVGDMFSLDFAQAYEDVAAYAARKGCRRALYVDAFTRTRQTRRRLSLFRRAVREHCPGAAVDVTTLVRRVGSRPSAAAPRQARDGGGVLSSSKGAAAEADAKRRLREGGKDALLAEAARKRPDLVCGYVRDEWREALSSAYGGRITVINTVAAPGLRPVIELDTRGWAASILERLTGRLSDRKLPPGAFSFPVTFAAGGAGPHHGGVRPAGARQGCRGRAMQ
jgi:hypothetical protein